MTPTERAKAHAIRTYRLNWFLQFSKAEQERVIRAFIAGHRSGKGKR